jgi:hypothetical protein
MDLRKLIKETLEEHLDKSLVLKESVEMSDALKYHVENGMTLTNNIFRTYSESYFNLVNEVRNLYNEGKIHLNDKDKLMIESDLGKKVKIGKQYIYLDAPYVYETEKDTLTESKTPRGHNKFAVYTKNKTGGLKKVIFGESKLVVKESSNCLKKTDRTTAGYWSCNIGRFAKQLGLSSLNS